MQNCLRDFMTTLCMWIRPTTYALLYHRFFFIAIKIVSVSFMPQGKEYYICDVSVGIFITPPVEPNYGFLYLCPSSLICKTIILNATRISYSSLNNFRFLRCLLRLFHDGIANFSTFPRQNDFWQPLQIQLPWKLSCLQKPLVFLDMPIPRDYNPTSFLNEFL